MIVFVCFLLLYVVGWMGVGDVKFFIVVGLFVGWYGFVVVWFVLSMIFGLYVFVIMVLC